MAIDGANPQAAVRLKRFAHRQKSGCQTCRMRKVKCDERKPLCLRCQRAGYECRGLEYADGVGRAVVQKTWWQMVPSQSPPIMSIPSSPGHVTRFQASNDVRDILYLGKTAQIKAAAGFGSLATNTRAQSISLRTCIEFLPSITGYDLALDSAVACVANALRCCHLSPQEVQDGSQGSSLTASSSSAEQITLYKDRSLMLYARALKDLQHGLEDQQRSVRAELLLATVLLMYFEAIYGYTETGIIAHADGAAKLIQHRGPHRFSTVLEKRLLTTQYPLIVTSALFLGKSVFLNTPEWISVIRSCLVYSPSNEADGRIAMEYMIASMTALDLLAATAALATEKQLTQFERNKRRVDLLEKLDSAQKDYDEWRRCLEKDIRRVESKFTLFPEDALIPLNGYSDSDARINLWFWSEAGGLLLLRLHVALGGDGSHAVELTAQKLAQQGMALYKENSGRVRQQATFVFLMMASAVLATAEEWAQFAVDGDGALAETGLLFRWLARMGVQCPVT